MVNTAAALDLYHVIYHGRLLDPDHGESWEPGTRHFLQLPDPCPGERMEQGTRHFLLTGYVSYKIYAKYNWKSIYENLTTI